MMLCLALRSSPEQVYQRALQYFTVEEITEGFAAARGLALLAAPPDAQGPGPRPARRVRPAAADPTQPVSIQRWSARRVGLLVGMVLLAVLAGELIADSVSNAVAVKTPINTGNLGCTDMEPLWLMAQSVPSASQVPCVRELPTGWLIAQVAVNSGRSVITLNHDRAGPGAIVAELTASCDLGGAAEVGSDQPGMRRYERTERSAPQFSGHPLRRVPWPLPHQPDDRGGRAAARPAGEAPRILRPHHPPGPPACPGRPLRQTTPARPNG